MEIKAPLADLAKNKLIRLSKSCIGDAEKQAVMSVLDREYLGMGIEVQKFEKALSDFFNRPAICVVNGTAALHLAIQACKINYGDEVLVPSLTYIASFQAISATGATPIPCDIDKDTCLLDLNDAEKRITKQTKAIMPVHYTGGVGEMEYLYEFANKYNLRIIEDAAHAFGTIYNGKRVGSFGDISCFSFDGIKNMTSGEGGCIVTNDEDLLAEIQDSRLLGVTKDTENRYNNKRSWIFEVKNQGWRYHMSNIMAAIGMEQLKKFPKIAKKRQNLAKYYDHKFFNIREVVSLPRNYDEVVPHIYVVKIKSIKNKKLLQSKMLKKGIEIGFHYQPNHSLSYYKLNQTIPLRTSEDIWPQLITLPLHPDLSKDDIDFIIEELMKLL